MSGEYKDWLKKLHDEFEQRVRVIYYINTNLKGETSYVKRYIDSESWWSRIEYLTKEEYYNSYDVKTEIINKRLKK